MFFLLYAYICRSGVCNYYSDIIVLFFQVMDLSHCDGEFWSISPYFFFLGHFFCSPEIENEQLKIMYCSLLSYVAWWGSYQTVKIMNVRTYVYNNGTYLPSSSLWNIFDMAHILNCQVCLRGHFDPNFLIFDPTFPPK